MRQRDLKPSDADEKLEKKASPEFKADISQEWLEELDEDRTIDPENLDMECCRQPELYLKWSDRYVEADWVYELKSLKLGNVEGELQILCRADPDKFGIHNKTVTEALVKAGIRQSAEYRYAYRKHLEARKVKMWLQGVLAALDMKKRMLETLTTLHGQQYFAGPTIPHDLVNIWKENRKKTAGVKMAKLARRSTVPEEVYPTIEPSVGNVDNGESDDE